MAEDACSATLSGGRTLREFDGQEVRLGFFLLSADLGSYWID
jgi:hypothetical protein